MSEFGAGLRWYGSVRPGAVDRVLERAMGGEHTPYDWLARAVARGASAVLDLACGTGGLSRRLQADQRVVVGLDSSMSNLHHAELTGDGPWVLGSVDHVPFTEASFDAVVTSLGLGVTANRGRLLSEVARVLRPGGVFAALMPSLRPVTASDVATISRLAGFLRVTPTLPGSAEFQARKSLSLAGLTKVEDNRARFFFEVETPEDARILIDGLRPAPDRDRTRSAVEYLVTRASNTAVTVPLPMRRVVAIK